MKPELIFGLHAVRGLLDKNPLAVLELWILDTRNDKAVRAIVDKADKFGIHHQRVPRKTLDRLTGSATHQGVVARHRPSAASLSEDIGSLLEEVNETSLLLMLDGVTDPHNLGACLRNADAAGATGVIIPRNRGVGLTPAARKVASGAAESVPLMPVANLARAIGTIQSAGVVVVGTADDATECLYDIDLCGPRAFVLGGEQTGLRRLTREKCDQLVRIPMQGTLSSLNVASACAVVLFEARRQQR